MYSSYAYRCKLPSEDAQPSILEDVDETLFGVTKAHYLRETTTPVITTFKASRTPSGESSSSVRKLRRQTTTQKILDGTAIRATRKPTALSRAARNTRSITSYFPPGLSDEVAGEGKDAVAREHAPPGKRVLSPFVEENLAAKV